MSKFPSDDFCLCLPAEIWSVHAKYEIYTHRRHLCTRHLHPPQTLLKTLSTLSVREHVPPFLCSLPKPLHPSTPPPRAISLRGCRERLIYDICGRRAELWPSPVVHGKSSSASFFFSRNCASELRDAAVGSREGQRWVGEEENSQSSSSVMACLLTRIMDVLEAKARTEAGGKESDSLWPENPPCFHLNNNFKLCLPPLATVALIPVQSKTSVHQSSVGFRRFSAFLSKP